MLNPIDTRLLAHLGQDYAPIGRDEQLAREMQAKRSDWRAWWARVVWLPIIRRV